MTRERKTQNIDTLWMGIDDPQLVAIARRIAEREQRREKRYCKKCGRRLASVNPGPFCFAHSRAKMPKSGRVWREDKLDDERRGRK